MLAGLMKTALVAVVAMSGMAASCFSITDPFVVAVNVKDIKNTYNVTPGTVTFALACITKNPADYIDATFNVAGGGQLVDIIVKTNGSFAGSINNGQVRVGGSSQALQTLVTYSGPWAAFNTPQSLLQNNVTMTLNPTGVSTLLFSQAAGTGMSIDISIFAQLNATP